MEKEKGIQEERLDIQNVLKAMNWEARLEEARARRKKVLEQRQPEDDKAAALKARLSTANFSRDVTIEPAENLQELTATPEVKPQRAPIALIPVVQAPAENPPFAFEAAVAHTKLRSANEPIAVAAPERSVKGRLALGLGIGLGIGLSMLLGLLLIGSKFGLPVAEVPVAVAETSLTTTEPVAQQEILSVGSANEATEITSLIAETSLTSMAPDVDAKDPIPLSQVTFVAAQFEVPQIAGSVAGPLQHISFLAAPKARDGRPDTPASLERPDFEMLSSEIGSVVAKDKAPAAHLSAQDALLSEPRGTDHLKPLSTPERDLRFATAAISPPTSPSVLAGDTQSLSETSVLARLEGGLRPVSRPELSRVALTPELFETQPDTPVDGVANPQQPLSVEGSRLPGAEGYTVLVSAPVTIPVEEVNQFVASVRETGMSLRPVSRVNFKVTRTQVRFYHPEDAIAAKSIAERVGAEARDFTSFRPSPPTGMIEVFLAGDSQPAAPQKTKKVRPKSEADRLRDSLVQSLRRGDYL